MKQIAFSPLRKIKKTGKITVASYMAWRRLFATDSWTNFELSIDEEYKSFPKDAYVYDHKGKQLFFYDYHPDDIPVYKDHIQRDMLLATLSSVPNIKTPDNTFGISLGRDVYYCGTGIDCDGIPTFSHWTADYIATHINSDDKLLSFYPLTVDMVAKWFGWILYRLENVRLNR